MEIREATREDVPAIRTVAEASWGHDYPEVLSREAAAAGVHEWYSERRVREAVEAGDALVLVAERDEVVGFVHGAWAGDEGHVLRVYVAPDHRGEGAGSALLEAAVATLFERDVKRVGATVLRANEAGAAFYRAHGFEREGEASETEIAGERHAEHRFVLER